MPETEKSDTLVELHAQEYSKIKEEQVQRIQFRDNQIYVNLAATGAIGLFSVSDPSHLPALLIVPWVNVILGWLYLVNDQKVSAIGEYLRRELGLRMLDLIHATPQTRESLHWGLPKDICTHPVLFGWEVMHRADLDRGPRKKTQERVDLLTFVAPALVAIIACEIGTRFGLSLTRTFTLMLAKILVFALFQSLVLIEVLLTVFLYGRIRKSDKAVGAQKR